MSLPAPTLSMLPRGLLVAMAVVSAVAAPLAFSQAGGSSYELIHFCSTIDQRCGETHTALERLADPMPVHLHYAEESRALAARYGVEMFPTTVILEDGVPIGSMMGYRSVAALEFELGRLAEALGRADLPQREWLLQSVMPVPPDTGQVMSIDLTYDAGVFTVEAVEIFDGAPPKKEADSRHAYIVQVRDQYGLTLHSRPWNIARFIVPPPALEGQGAPQGPFAQDRFETTLILPYFPDAESVVLFQPYGVEALSTTIDVREMGPVPEDLSTADLGAIKITPIHVSGPDSQRLVILFLGDQYGASQTALYNSDVAAHAAFLLGTKPFKTRKYKKNINIYRVDGARRLKCKYKCGGIDRLICCKNARVLKAAAKSGISYDEIIVLVNDDAYGGSGQVTIGGGGSSTYAVAYHLVSDWGRHVAVHELGHSFGGLMDEYEYGTSGTPFGPNCDYSPCKSWGPKGSLGCFKGCSYIGLSRPTKNSCLMNTLTRDKGFVFCRVCTARLNALRKNY